MRFVATTMIALWLTSPLSAWELLLTKGGTELEGDMAQQEFILTDPTGGEVVIPRAAIAKFEAKEDGLTAVLKDGTTIFGYLETKLEMQDGLVLRRYPGAEIERVEFDQYIVVEAGKKYHSCPIRIEFDASPFLLSKNTRHTTALPNAVNCNELRIGNIAFARKGSVQAGKDVSIDAKVAVSVPGNIDQLVDLSLQLLQGETVIATGNKRLTVDSGEVNEVSLELNFPGENLDTAETKPRLRVQLVNQDAELAVERGGVFWWFTIHFNL